MLRFPILLACLLLPAIFLLACNSAPSDKHTGMEGEQKFAWKDVSLKRWRLVELDGAAIAADRNVELKFDGVNRISGNAGINQIMGGCEHALVDGGERGYEYKVQIGPLSSTRMAGSPESMKLETDFLAALGEVSSARMIDGKLLLLKGEEVSMRFEGLR